MSADRQQEMIDRVLAKHAASIHLTRPPRTPLEELMGREEEGLSRQEEERHEMRIEILIRLLEYIFQDGCEPIKILRFVYALVKSIKPQLIADMPLADISVICADAGKATVSARIQRIYNGTIQKAGGKGSAAPFQKRGNYSAAQLGNSNRTKKTEAKLTKNHAVMQRLADQQLKKS